MEWPVASPHELRNPETLPRPRGFTHVVIAQPGRTVYLAGQTAQQADGRVLDGTMVEQFDIAAGNVIHALAAAGARPQDLVSMQIFVTDIAGYRDSSREIGDVYRRHFGNHYPAMALLEVRRLFDPEAKIELMCIAVTA